MAIDLDGVIARLRGNPSIEISPLTVETTLEMRSLGSIPEMHDLLIACETRVRKAVLITRDEAIRKSQAVEVVW